MHHFHLQQIKKKKKRGGGGGRRSSTDQIQEDLYFLRNDMKTEEKLQ